MMFTFKEFIKLLYEIKDIGEHPYSNVRPIDGFAFQRSRNRIIVSDPDLTTHRWIMECRGAIHPIIPLLLESLPDEMRLVVRRGTLDAMVKASAYIDTVRSLTISDECIRIQHATGEYEFRCELDHNIDIPRMEHWEHWDTTVLTSDFLTAIDTAYEDVHKASRKGDGSIGLVHPWWTGQAVLALNPVRMRTIPVDMAPNRSAIYMPIPSVIRKKFTSKRKNNYDLTFSNDRYDEGTYVINCADNFTCLYSVSSCDDYAAFATELMAGDWHTIAKIDPTTFPKQFLDHSNYAQFRTFDGRAYVRIACGEGSVCADVGKAIADNVQLLLAPGTVKRFTLGGEFAVQGVLQPAYDDSPLVRLGDTVERSMSTDTIEQWCAMPWDFTAPLPVPDEAPHKVQRKEPRKPSPSPAPTPTFAAVATDADTPPQPDQEDFNRLRWMQTWGAPTCTPSRLRTKRSIERLAAAGYIDAQWQGQTCTFRILRHW